MIGKRKTLVQEAAPVKVKCVPPATASLRNVKYQGRARLDSHVQPTMLTAMSSAIVSLFRLHQAGHLIQGSLPRA